VTLIIRGSEVGGGDARSDVGTLARILDAVEAEDGRWAVVAAGEQRLRVLRWLPEAPYPRAEVETMVEPPAGADAVTLRFEAERLLRRALALAAELGEPAAPTGVAIAADPVSASYQIAALAPIGPFDGQRVLEVPGAEERLRLLGSLLAEQVGVLSLRLEGR
jgi:Lon protease-like protein